MKRSISQQGMGLLEIVVGLSILAVTMASMVMTYKAYIRASFATTESIQASYLAEETFEAVKMLRDKSWTSNIATLTNGTTYYLYWNGSTWVATTTLQYVDNQFLRSFKLAAVNRDSNDDIAVSGTLDANTKKVDVSVAWQVAPATTTKTLSTYITNLFSN
jgi:type II secretory pathway pseudopilin PulG